MRRLVLACAVAGMALSSCAGEHAGMSTLQRFDALRPELQQVGRDSQAVSQDIRRLDGDMRSARWRSTRSDAVQLKLDALHLSRRAGRAGIQVRTLLHRERNGQRNFYYRSTLEALAFQWCEGITLSRVANLVWYDPLIMRAGDEVRLGHLQGRAQWCAWKSVVWSRMSRNWRQRHARLYRYVPVTATPIASR